MSNKLIRLNSVGYLAEGGEDKSESVYERPVMLVYTGEFQSMDGPVTISEEHINLLSKNHNSLLERVKRLASGDIPMRDCPPLQLDHSTSAQHTVGRLVGALTVGHIDIDGKQNLALFGTARFLGRENVEKAKDGRYTHVSIGADLEKGTINELSVTPFPAAPNAALLGKGEEKEPPKGEEPMHEKLKKHLMEHKKMSDEDAEKLSKEALAHHMKHMGMDEEKMGKHMAEAKDEDVKKMSEDYDAHMKHLADEKAKEDKEKAEKEEKESKMAAAREGFTKLAKGLKVSATAIRSEVKLASVKARLSKLRAEGKITPAEIQNLDPVKLAAMSDKEVEAAFAMAEARQPVIRFGLTHGSSKADSIERVAKKYRMASLEFESRLNMPSKKAEAEAMLAKLKEEEKTELSRLAGSEEVTKGLLTKVGYDELVSMLDDKGRHEELKKHLKHLVDIHGDGDYGSEGEEKHMSALAKRQDELQTKLDELITIAAPAMGVRAEELI
jgi:hypothetical protein